MDTSIILAPAPLALCAYTIGLYALTSAYKRALRLLAKHSGPRAQLLAARLAIFNPLVSTSAGAASGPLVVPWLFELAGSTGAVPIVSSIFAGAAAGAMSSVLWQTLHKVLARLAGGALADEEADR